MAISNIVVLGAGQMGSGIAQVLAQAGYRVYMRDVSKQYVERGLERIEKFLRRFVSKGKIREEEKEEILKRITGTTSLAAVRDADLVIEAVPEDLELKSKVFAEVDELAPEHCILASNTSSLSITELAAKTKRPDRVIGMHFMNPVPLMRLVEVIRGLATSDETFEKAVLIVEACGKLPVEVKDSPGFVLNRILLPMINEACFCLQEGVASPEDIDQVMKNGANHPMGPLELADLIGLDTCLSVMQTLYRDFGDPKYRPCPLLVRMVKAGYLGRKSGKGFYKY